MTLKYAKTVAYALSSSFLLILLIFLSTKAVLRFLPGNPVQAMLAESGSTLNEEALSEELGLNIPFFQSVKQDIINLTLHGDLGRSLISREDLAPLVVSRLKKTALLASLTAIVTVIISLLLGILSTQSSLISQFTLYYSSAVVSLPMAWIGPLMIYLFAVKVPLFQVGQSPIFPALCLGLLQSGYWARTIKIQMSESLVTGSATGARARGIPEYKVLIKYGFYPIAGPLCALFATHLGNMLAGAYLTEIIFDWPGMGNLFLDSVLRRDYPAVQACIFVSASCSVLGVRLGDWLQRITNPKLREAPS